MSASRERLAQDRRAWSTIDPKFRPCATTVAAARFFGKTVEEWLTPGYSAPSRGFVRYMADYECGADCDVFHGEIET